MKKIFFIGIGAMGEPMATNLLKKGFEVNIIRNRSSTPVERLAAAGANVANTIMQAGADVDCAVLCLPTSREVDICVAGEGGLLSSMRRGSVIVDCSTSFPENTRQLGRLLNERGIAMVDAGLTRGVAGAKQGTLAFFIGGESGHIEMVMPVLKAMGDTFICLGKLGDGHATKVISNVLSYTTVALVSEALALGGQAGVDPEKLFEALMQGAPSKALEAFGPRILKGEYVPARVTVDHVCEDMVMAQKMANSSNTAAGFIGFAQTMFRMLSRRGFGGKDVAAVAEISK